MSILDEVQQSEAPNQLYNILRLKYLGLSPAYSARDCVEIRMNDPTAASGWYFVRSQERVYCYYDFQTPSPVNGWERLVYSNLSDTSESCPGTQFNLVESVGARYCVKNFDGYGCSSLWISPTQPVRRVFGRVFGIQVGSGDIRTDLGIEDPYLDGVSLTYGEAGSRRHIWSFMAYTSEFFNQCPCSIDSPNSQSLQSFVGDNYYCESGANTMNVPGTMEFPNDLLWDGQLCRETEVPCCAGNVPPPWFYRELNSPTSERIELRICTDQDMNDESVGVQLIDIYIQ